MLLLLLACASDADRDGWVSPDDCDDQDAAVSPDAPDDDCDGIDDDCDGLIDEGSRNPRVLYRDADGDGYGDADEVGTGCVGASGWSDEPTDCDDADATVHPGAEDTTCDATDQDCDGDLDQDAPEVAWFYADLDGDGLGDPASRSTGCTAPPGTVADSRDCDDTTPGDTLCAEDIPQGTAWATLVAPYDEWLVDAIEPAGDPDGDGYEDALVTLTGATWLYGAVTPGDGALGDASTRFTPDHGGEARSAGDVDGDGLPDVLVPSTEGDGGAYLYTAVGPGEHDESDASAVITGTPERSLKDWTAAGDLDADGRGDLWASLESGELALFSGGVGDVDASAATALITRDEEWWPDALDAGDLDGDGTPDLIVGVDDEVRVWFAPEPGWFGEVSPDRTFDLEEGRVESLALPDLDGDGHAEAVVGNPEDATGGDGAGCVWIWGDATTQILGSPAAGLGQAHAVTGPDGSLLLVGGTQQDGFDAYHGGVLYGVEDLVAGTVSIDEAARWRVQGEEELAWMDSGGTADVDTDGVVELLAVGPAYGPAVLWVLELP